MESARFIAILLGTISGGLAVRYGGDPASLSLLIIILSLMSFGASLFMPATGEAAPGVVAQMTARDAGGVTWPLDRSGISSAGVPSTP